MMHGDAWLLGSLYFAFGSWLETFRWKPPWHMQGQGRTWLLNKEGPAGLRVTTLNDKQFRNHLEEALR